MKRNKVIVISLIIAIIIIVTIFIIKSNNNQSHKNSNTPIESSDISITDNIQENKNTNNQSNVALENNNNNNNNHNHINTEGTNVEQIENKENSNIIYPNGRLFITFDNKIYLPSTAVQEFNFDFPKTSSNERIKLIKKYFNDLWNILECEVITITENDYDATAKLQFSRYEVPTNDLTFYLSSTLNFYEGGTHIIDDPLLYTEYFSNYIYVRIANSNIGRSIHAFKINDMWYAYKLNVIE